MSRYFSVVSISSQKSNDETTFEDNLTQDMALLSLRLPSFIYSVDWDTSITIEDNSKNSLPSTEENVRPTSPRVIYALRQLLSSRI